MRINDLIALLIPTQPAVGSGGLLGLGASGGGSRDQRGIAVPKVRAPATAAPDGPTLVNGDGDRADLLSLFASRAGVSAAAFTPDQAPAAADPFANGASIVDGYIRKRAILAYRFPQQSQYGPQIDLTFDIEVAYRTIDILPAGATIDQQG